MAVDFLDPVSNDAEALIDISQPYVARVIVQGTAPLLFHRWSNEDVEGKSKAAKGSTAKKTDNIEAYIYRCDNGDLGIPSEYFRMAVVTAAKFRQDPRSPRKSAMDLFKAGLAGLDELCSTGLQEWDYLDRRRAMVQRNAITRVRPALLAGWRAEVQMSVLVPEYISPDVLHETFTQAGRLIGVGDFRPTYGRFQIVSWEIGPA